MKIERDKSRPFANDPDNPAPDDGKHYGFYQLCPKCDGEGKLVADYWDGTVYVSERTCPVCNGEKVIVRPEVKTGE